MAIESEAGGGWMNRAASGWCKFWFTPADPTPLALMRIVAGLLTIYVHIAYCFDLTAFFGPNAWYDQQTAANRRTKIPIVLPPSSWDERPIDYLLPTDVGQRRALTVFIDGYFKSQTPAQAEFLRSLSGVPDERATLMRWLKALPDDPAARAALFERYVADTVTPDERGQLPDFMIRQPSVDSRQQLSAALQRFLAILPPTLHERNVLFSLFAEMSGADWIRYQEFLRNLPAEDAERTAVLKYMEDWNVHPKLTYAQGFDTYSPWYHVTDARLMWGIHLAHLAVMVLFTIGLWTRVTSVMTWLAGLTYINRAQPVLFGQDTMMNLALFYLMLSPCGAVWSVDWLIQRYRSAKKTVAGGLPLVGSLAVPKLVSAGFVIRLFQIQYCLMYMSAGASKLKGNSWWTGTAPWLCLANPEFSPMHIALYRDFLAWLSEHRWLWELHMNSVVVFTLVLELAFPTIVWTRLRPIAVGCALILHLGIAVIMGLSVFSLFMFTLLLCWFPADVIRWFFARKPAELPKWRLRFNTKSEEQSTVAARVYALDVWNQVDYVDSPTGPALEPVGRNGPTPPLGQGVVATFGIFKSLNWLPGAKMAAQLFLPANSPRRQNGAKEQVPVGAN